MPRGCGFRQQRILDAKVIAPFMLMRTIGLSSPHTSMAEHLFEVDIPAGFVGPIQLVDGRLLAVDAELNAHHSTNGGRSWNSSGPLFGSGGYLPPGGIMPQSMIRLASGAIAVNYWQQLPEPVGMREFQTCIRKTEDEGRSWSDPVQITFPNLPAYPTYLLQTRSGRLILPN